MIRTTPSALGMLKSAPAPKTPRASSTSPVISWAAITSERARHAGLPRGYRDGAHDHRPEHARGQRVDDRAARKLRPGHEERDHKRAKTGREAGDRDQPSGAQAPLGGPGQARLDRHAHASQRREDEDGSHWFSLRFVVSSRRPIETPAGLYAGGDRFSGIRGGYTCYCCFLANQSANARRIIVEEMLGGARITYLGHSAFRFTTAGGEQIIIDPFLTNNPHCPP